MVKNTVITVSTLEEYQRIEIERLKNALRKINNALVRTGPNSMGMSISLFELKGIAETALGEDNEQKSQ